MIDETARATFRKRLVVLSHKVCWFSEASTSGYAADGGFPLQMRAISDLFEETTLLVPCAASGAQVGEMALTGKNLSVRPLTPPRGVAWRRKLRFPAWLLWNLPRIVRELRRADAVHAPIPGDVGTVGMLLACLMRKPLLVRHCGNWFVQRTAAERFWKWFIERFAGGRRVMLATGGAAGPPSARNGAVRWIFSTSLTTTELDELARRPKDAAPPWRLIIVCRQDEPKGTGRVIKALPQLLAEFPGLSLDVVGEGPALAGFRQLADSLSLHKNVRFHGKLNHEGVLGLLCQATLFCYPTTASEGFPKVVVEALACGLPVLTTRVSVLPQLLEAGGGILLADDSPDTLADAIRACLRDRADLAAMSQAAQAIARRFSLERWRDEIGEHLRDAWEPQAIA